jgi:hypothetical protein
VEKHKIENTLEKMVELSESLNDLRVDAREEGFQVQALTFLANVRMKNPKDHGASILKELIEYAQATGSFPDLITKQNQESQVAAPQQKDMSIKSTNNQISISANMKLDNSKAEKLHMLKEILFSITVAAFLLWLLH